MNTTSKVTLVFSAISITVSLAVLVRIEKANDEAEKRRHKLIDADEEHEECTDYKAGDVVKITDGEITYATGTVQGFTQSKKGLCLYKVRTQRGVEMPAVEYYEGWELEILPEDKEA